MTTQQQTQDAAARADVHVKKITQQVSYNCATWAAILSAIHVLVTTYTCTTQTGVVQGLNPRNITTEASSGRLKGYGKDYIGISIIVLITIFGLSIGSHAYVVQNDPEKDVTKRSTADALYTVVMMLLAILAAITFSSEPGCQNQRYHYSKLGLLVALTVFTGAIAVGRKP